MASYACPIGIKRCKFKYANMQDYEGDYKNHAIEKRNENRLFELQCMTVFPNTFPGIQELM